MAAQESWRTLGKNASAPRRYGLACLACALAMAAGVGWSPDSKGALAGATDGAGLRADSRVVAAWTCELNARLATTPESKAGREAQLAGRGLASCKNAQGFEFDVPLLVEMSLSAKKGTVGLIGDAAIAISSATFSTARALEELDDRFEPVSSANALATPERKKMWARGADRNLIIEMELASSSPALAGLDVKDLRLRIDDAAPELRP